MTDDPNDAACGFAQPEETRLNQRRLMRGAQRGALCAGRIVDHGGPDAGLRIRPATLGWDAGGKRQTLAAVVTSTGATVPATDIRSGWPMRRADRSTSGGMERCSGALAHRQPRKILKYQENQRR